jgi:hypothetical protein
MPHLKRLAGDDDASLKHIIAIILEILNENDINFNESKKGS